MHLTGQILQEQMHDNGDVRIIQEHAHVVQIPDAHCVHRLGCMTASWYSGHWLKGQVIPSCKLVRSNEPPPPHTPVPPFRSANVADGWSWTTATAIPIHVIDSFFDTQYRTALKGSSHFV